MTNLLQNLENLCNACTFSAKHQPLAHDFTDLLQQQNAAIKKHLKDLCFQTVDTATFQNIINLHDSFLNEMLDNLTYHLDIEKTRTSVIHSQPPANPDALFAAYHQVSNLLEFIHNHFNQYISQHRSISRHYRHIAVSDIKKARSFIEDHLPEHTCDKIRNFLIQPLADFLTLEAKCTWHTLYYCQQIVAEFKTMLSEGLPSNDDLIWLLFKLNYNDCAFYIHITSYFRKQVQVEYLEYLYTLQRLVGQTIFPQNLVLDPDAAPIDQMINKWLKEEIDHLKRIAVLQLRAAPAKQNDIQPDKNWANMSVAEFAYLFKLCTETGLLKITNCTNFFEAISRRFRTKNSENISAESLRTKYYAPHPQVKSNVKEYIIDLLNKVNSQS